MDIFITMLNEGMIKITPSEKNAIKRYFSQLLRYINKQFVGEEGRTVAIDSYNVVSLLNDYSNEINPFPFKIKYFFSASRDNAYYSHDSETISINLHGSVDYNRTLYGDFIFGVKPNELFLSFIHEFVHYKQDISRKSKSGDKYKLPTDWNDKEKYWARPWENQAWAAQYIEYLRDKMKIKDPKKILGQLKKMGVLHNPDLNRLKKTDLHAWKRIMKNAIMYALQGSEK